MLHNTRLVTVKHSGVYKKHVVHDYPFDVFFEGGGATSTFKSI